MTKSGNKDITGDGKLAVLFPGIGYTCDKPLLYYSRKLLLELGYRVIPVQYGNFPPNVKGDSLKMQLCFAGALEQAEELLKEIDWSRWGEVVFVGKSIGTAVAARYASEHGLAVRHIWLTPLSETFVCGAGETIAFHGTSDPWAETGEIRALCEERKIPLYLTEKANHSLETGDTKKDLAVLADTLEEIRAFLSSEDLRIAQNACLHFLT